MPFWASTNGTDGGCTGCGVCSDCNPRPTPRCERCGQDIPDHAPAVTVDGLTYCTRACAAADGAVAA